jgi:hypothetical protein
LFASALRVLAIFDGIIIRSVELESQLAKCILPIFLISICTRKKKAPEWLHKAIAIFFLAPLIVTIATERMCG